jgi:hypothetical protein
MSDVIEVSTQDELDGALAKDPNASVHLVAGRFSLSIRSGAPFLSVSAGAELSIEARDSSQPRIVARDSSQPRIEARDSSQPRIEARDSSQPRIEARDSSQPRIEARGYAQVSLLGPVRGTAADTVSVLIDGEAKIDGGMQVRLALRTPQDWCAYHGVAVNEGVAILYKGVDATYKSARGGDYTPGSIPRAHDWDGGADECAGGFSFSPTPISTHEFVISPARYVACPVALADMRAPQPDDAYRSKIKAAGCCGPVFEVDEDGAAIVSEEETA